MKTFEELYFSLSDIKLEIDSKESFEIIYKFYNNFKELKKKDNEKFQKKNNFKEIVQNFEKAIFDLDDKKTDLSFLNPIFLLLDFSKKNNLIPKMHFSALGKSLDNYICLMESVDLTKKISHYFFDLIDFFKLEDFSFFSRNLIIDENKKNILKKKIVEKIQNFKRPYNRDKILKILKLINYLKIENTFNFSKLIKIIIEIKLTDIFFDNFKKNKKICLELLKNLKVGPHCKIMNKIIKSFNLDFNNFPNLIKYQKNLAFNFLYKKFDIFKLEDKGTLQKDDFLTLLHFLERKKLKNEAFSFYQRNKDKFSLNIQKYEKKHNFNFIPNLFIKNDFFGPASILLKKKEKFITLTNLGYKKNDISVVNSLNLEIHLPKILNSEKIGFDCEFYSENCSNFSESKLALLQIAIKKEIFLFDCIDILQKPLKSKKFTTFFKNLIKKNSIIKIGHSFHGDIKVFEKTFQIEISEINNLINIESIYTHKGMALSKMTKNIFDLEMCKYEQISSWQRRPLRGTQIHYAALDAAVLCEIYERVLEENSRLGRFEVGKDEGDWNEEREDDNVNYEKDKKKKRF